MGAGVAAGHGENFPHQFFACNHCGHKTLYIAKSGGISVMLRCKTCKHEKFIPCEQYTNDKTEIELFNIDLRL